MVSFAPVFIVGTGRCGSTLMSNLVSLHPDILSLSEVFTTFTTRAFVSRQLDGPAFWNMLKHPSPVLRKSITPETSPVEFTYKFGPGALFTPSTLPACMMMTLPHLADDADHLYAELEPVIRARPKAALAEQYRYWFDWMAKRQGKKLWIERTGSSITMVKALNRLFPDAKFVHIHRDGRETALSMQAFKPMRVFLHMRRRLKRFGIDILKTPFRYSDSRVIYALAPFIEQVTPTEALLERVPSVGDIGRFWSDMIDIGLRDLSTLPQHRVHTMAYADLVSRPVETLEAFIAFAAPGVPDKAWIEAASGIPRQKPQAWRSLSKTNLLALERACAKGQRLLGYSSG
ncbi:MAG: sulfotransferase [Pseudomonadota bacterium]